MFHVKHNNNKDNILHVHIGTHTHAHAHAGRHAGRRRAGGRRRRRRRAHAPDTPDTPDAPASAHPPATVQIIERAAHRSSKWASKQGQRIYLLLYIYVACYYYAGCLICTFPSIYIERELRKKPSKNPLTAYSALAII